MIRSRLTLGISSTATSVKSSWIASDPEQADFAKKELEVWPLDEYNAMLLNEVHPLDYGQSNEPHSVYDLIAIGAGAGGLVSSRQSARRGARSALISEKLAGGDCLNVGCVPSKAILRAAKAISSIRKAYEFGVISNEEATLKVDFAAIMRRMRKLRAKIATVDSHETSVVAGTHVYQGRGVLTSPSTVMVNGVSLRFRKAVIATGGRPNVPSSITGLKEAPYVTNENLFNLQSLPPRMVILGAGVVALEMAQSFAIFGSHVTVLQRNPTLFSSKYGDPEAAELLRKELTKNGVHFVTGSTQLVETLRTPTENTSELPLIKVVVMTQDSHEITLECECLLVAIGRTANVENVGLEAGNVNFEIGRGIKVNDFAQSESNPDVYAVGDCVADVPRLTHMSGEMAKVVVQNSLFGDGWRLSSLVVPACMYTEPEYATIGVSSEAMAEHQGIKTDVYKTSLEHNDRAILEGSNIGFCKIFCRKGTDEILGATIVADRAGDIINEISLAIKNKIGLYDIGRNIHCYPTTGECVMMCGVQYINTKVLKRFDEK